MPAELVDRDGGVIETRAKVDGSLLEPWDWPRGEAGAGLESTLAFQRRRMRFEFLPAGFRPRIPGDDEQLLGPRVPGSITDGSSGTIDLTRLDEPVEVRVWVWTERAFTPGLQRSAWTFSQTSFYSNPLKDRPIGDGTTRDRSIWTPLARDPVMEADVLAELRRRLVVQAAPPEQPVAP
jgi:hypothetical protein